MSWRLVFRKPDGTWEQVRARGEFGTKLDTANTVEFEPVDDDGTSHRGEAPAKPIGRNPPMASVPGRDRTEAGFALDPRRLFQRRPCCAMAQRRRSPKSCARAAGW